MTIELIEENEEINCFVGMNITDVEPDLEDKNLSYRVHAKFYTMTKTRSGRNVQMWGGKELENDPNRINLVIENDVVVKVYYG